MAIIDGVREVCRHYQSTTDPLLSAYLRREGAMWEAMMLPSTNTTDPYREAFERLARTITWTGSIEEKFGTLFAHSLTLIFNEYAPHEALSAGFSKWLFDSPKKQRLFMQSQVLLLSAFVTVAIIEFPGVYENYEKTATERLSIVGVVMRRAFSALDDESSVRELMRSINAFTSVWTDDREYKEIVGSLLHCFAKEGKESNGFYLLLEEAMRRTLPMVIQVDAKF